MQWSDCVDAQAGLCLCFSHISKSDFLAIRCIYRFRKFHMVIPLLLLYQIFLKITIKFHVIASHIASMPFVS